MRLNEILSIEKAERGFFLIKLESETLNLETLQLIPQGLEKVKQFSNVNGVLLKVDKLKGPSFHDFNLYTQKEGLLGSYLDSGKFCIQYFKNLPFPFGFYIKNFIMDMGIELLINVPHVFFSPKAYIKWNYFEIPILPLFGNIKNFFKYFGLEKTFEIFLRGKTFYLKEIFNVLPIPEIFLIESLENFFKIKFERKTESFLGKLKEKFLWIKLKKGLDNDSKELLAKIVSLYLKNKLSQEDEEIIQREYLLKESIQNKIKYLIGKEEVKNLEVSEEIKIPGKVLILGLKEENLDFIKKTMEKGFEVKIIEGNEDLLEKSLIKIEKNCPFSFSLKYYGLLNYPIVIENLNIKEEEKAEIINNLCSNFNINGIFLTSLKVSVLKSIEKRYEHPTKIVGYHIPKALPGKDFVEIIKGSRTSQETLKIVSKFFYSIGYFPIVVLDKPGFLVLRIVSGLLNESFYLLEEGFSPIFIENAFKSIGFKRGPFQLGDEFGYSAVSNVAHLLSLLSKDFYKPNKYFSILAELEKFEKRFQIKFFLYKNGNPYSENKKLLKHLGIKPKKHLENSEIFYEVSERLHCCLLNLSFNAIEQGVIDWTDKVDLALSFIMGTPSSGLGVIKNGNWLGWPHILGIMNKLKSKYGERYNPSKSIIELAENI